MGPTDRPGREILKEYREVVAELIDHQGWRYDCSGKGRPHLYPADPAQPPISVPKTPQLPAQPRGLPTQDQATRRPVAPRRKVKTVDWYSVTIGCRSPREDQRQVTDEQVDALMDLVERYNGVVTGGEGYSAWDATVGVTADDSLTAVSEAYHLVFSLVAEAGLPQWPAVRVEAMREDVLEEENARPNYPDLVSGAEAARILGVSRQRLHTLAAQHPGFPRPMYELGVGKIWLRAAIEAFDQRWERRPGWPKGVSRRSA